MTTTQAKSTYRYTMPGVYTVTLTVSDAAGLTNSKAAPLLAGIR